MDRCSAIWEIFLYPLFSAAISDVGFIECDVVGTIQFSVSHASLGAYHRV